jgi:hypothetical protein
MLSKYMIACIALLLEIASGNRERQLYGEDGLPYTAPDAHLAAMIPYDAVYD